MNMQGDYLHTSIPLINGKYSLSHEPTFRSKATEGPGYTAGGSNGRGGYGMGSKGASYSLNKASTYGKGFGGSGGKMREGSKKNKY